VKTGTRVSSGPVVVAHCRTLSALLSRSVPKSVRDGKVLMAVTGWIPKSFLGRCVPSSHVNEGTILVAMKAYFDGSGKRESDFLVLSGVAADDKTWGGFDTESCRILSDREPKAPYLHMQELSSLNGSFKAENGWNDENAHKLVTDCLMYAQSMDKEKFRTFTCSIDMAAYRDLQADGSLLPGCYELCVFFSPQRVLKWYIQRFNDAFPQELHYFFDQGERFKGVFEQRWIAGKKGGRGLSNHWHLIKSIATVDSKCTPAVQLADLCAWSCHRKLMVDRYGKATKYQHLAMLSEKILPFDRKPLGVDDLALIASMAENFPVSLHDLFLSPKAKSK
jgi:hypothetical protein